MAGLSLQCGDCGVLLKSVEEAQEHAELTSHSNFAESTEAVLNLVCSTCRKPCRSKTESDLHTKRTGHTDFVDKTLETANPISLELPKPSVDSDGVGGASTSNMESEEMVAPEVDKNLLGELEAMGFPINRGTRALHYTGNAGLEAAVNWIVEHENDTDIDEIPMVPVNSKAESRMPSLTPEEMKIKAQELRIRAGKELLEAKRIEEDNERKRIIALRKAEKEEEKRAREKFVRKWRKIRFVQRRRKLGLPPEDPTVSRPAAVPVVEEKKTFLPIKPVTKVEKMREWLRALKQNHKSIPNSPYLCGNVAKNPDEEKFRKIRLTNQSFQDRVGSMRGGVEFLEVLGFEKIEGEFMFLPRDKVDMVVLNSAGSELNSAIINPFFGVL
ncbi:hypothetical protein MKW92_040218 [Papaver armeniacum]|nr:hypothetical protein MKW92_040218 [Papaver armeniacum]